MEELIVGAFEIEDKEVLMDEIMNRHGQDEGATSVSRSNKTDSVLF